MLLSKSVSIGSQVAFIALQLQNPAVFTNKNEIRVLITSLLTAV